MLTASARSRSATSGSIWSLAFLLVTAVAFGIRLLAVAEPLGIDQSLWASAVRGMSRGLKLYQDVWEQRPPGIYLTYLGGFSLLGWTPATVAWLDVFASLLTTALLYAIARTLAGAVTGALAAALYSLLTLPAWLYSYGGFLERSVCETFIVVCAAFASLCAVRHRERPTAMTAFGFGLSAGAAVVFKPNAALCFPALFVWSLTGGWSRPALPGPLIVRACAAAVVGATVIPVLTILWLWRLDLTGDAWTAVVDFNRWYVAQGFTPGVYALAFSRAVWLRIKTDPLWLAGALAAIGALTDLVRMRRLPSLPTLAIVWGAGTAMVIAVNGIRLFNSYFIQALAPLALLVSWWLTSGTSGGRLRRASVAVTIVAMFAVMVQRNFASKIADVAWADARVLTGRMAQQTYLERFGSYANQRGYSARANQELADYLAAHTEREDRVFLFGINGAGVYFLSDRLPAHRFLRANFFVPDGFPDPSFTLVAVVSDLIERRPVYVIFEQLHTGSAAGTIDELPHHPHLQPLLQGYELEVRIEDFALYRRK